ncbi:MAG: hypothetical protein AAFV72_07555 [Cyanobacteria bacterium J06635_1]
MTLQELTEQASRLSFDERLALLVAIEQTLDLDKEKTKTWQYLVQRVHPWRNQLYLKGRKLLASTVWQDMQANDMTPEEAADNWVLPVAAIHEVIAYCQMNSDLICLEAEEEKHRLEI